MKQNKEINRIHDSKKIFFYLYAGMTNSVCFRETFAFE